MIGFTGTAQALLADESVLEEAEFNPVKTWIEYINRIVGVIIGLLIIALTFRSLRYWHADRIIVIGSFASLILVVFQGWIGSFVVSTNLTPWTVTVHMFLALALVVLLMFLVVRADQHGSIFRETFSPAWIYAAMGLLLVQILVGTQVRQAIDLVSRGVERSEWIAGLGTEFLLHRSFSWVVLLVHVMVVYKMTKSSAVKAFRLLLILLILGTIATGTGMAYLRVPAFLQPLHLLLSTALFGLLVFLLLQLYRRQQTVIG
jgi:cytochrome c oxidase assembly protein subunit 15